VINVAMIDQHWRHLMLTSRITEGGKSQF